MGGLNFDEKDFQLAFGYELDKSKIDYMREISLEVFYKDIPVKLGSPDFFLNKSKPPLILELKLSSSIQNSHRQQLKMYLVSVKRKPKSVVATIKHGMIINFLKEDSSVVKDLEGKNKKNQSLKLSLDTKSDFELIKKLYENKNYDFLIKTDKAIKEFKTIV